MVEQVEYSPRERFGLWTLAVFGFLTVNGAFMYGLFQPGATTAVVLERDGKAGGGGVASGLHVGYRW